MSRNMVETFVSGKTEESVKQISEDQMFDSYYEDLSDCRCEELEKLLQYVADHHLCGTPLIEGMKKLGIEYTKEE